MYIRGQKQDKKIKILIKKILFITLCDNLNANIWKMANQRYQVLSPATCTLFGKEVFTDVVKLKTSRWEDYLELSRSDLNLVICFLISERHRDIWTYTKYVCLTMRQILEWCSYQPKKHQQSPESGQSKRKFLP